MEEDTLTEEDIAKLSNLVGTTPTPEQQQNIHSFLHNVAVARDTTKTGNLSIEELGLPTLPLRTYKELSLFCREVADMDYYSDYFARKGEILTSTSLSKEAKLLGLAILQKREVADVTKTPRKPNRGWFKPKQNNPTEGTE
jgi:hypothetical protein